MDTPTLVGTGFLILGGVVWVVSAIYAWRLAPTFGRNRIGWTIAAIIFGPLALMLLYILPRHAPLPGHGKAHHDPQADLYEKPHKR